MNTYNISSGLRTLFLAMIGIGVLCMAITFIGADDAHHSRFWSNFLHNSVFFTGIAIMASFFIAASILAYAGWFTAFKRLFEAITAFLPYGLGLVLIVAVGNYLHLHHLYHWTDAEAVKNDPILLGKSGFLNSNFYLIATLLFGGAYVVLINKIKSLSVAEDKTPDSSFKLHKDQRFWAAILLPVIGFTSVILIWQWIMSVDAHWYSTMFAWYTLASWFVSMMCFATLSLLYLRGNGYYQNLNQHHIHDMGKFVFAFSVFWTYLWFSQFMLIWYANVGEETIYFKERYDNYPVLFFSNLAVNFVLPFIVLLRNDTKRKIGTLSFVAIIVFIFHWVDFFLMIKPGVLHTVHEAAGHGAHGAEDHAGHDHSHTAEHVSNFVSGFTMPGLLELGTMLGFLGFFCLIVFNALGKHPLTPKNDPYLEESLHHHV